MKNHPCLLPTHTATPACQPEVAVGCVRLAPSIGCPAGTPLVLSPSSSVVLPSRCACPAPNLCTPRALRPRLVGQRTSCARRGALPLPRRNAPLAPAAPRHLPTPQGRRPAPVPGPPRTPPIASATLTTPRADRPRRAPHLKPPPSEPQMQPRRPDQRSVIATGGVRRRARPEGQARGRERCGSERRRVWDPAMPRAGAGGAARRVVRWGGRRWVSH